MTGQQLKNSILQMAIQGKLVPQDPRDEPASILLERIREEKKRLVKEGVLKKKDLEEKDISEEEIPFDIPEGWEWCRMNFALDVRDGTHDTPKYVNEGYPLVTSKNLRNNQIDFSTTLLISELDYLSISQRSAVNDNDILFAMIGTIGNPVLVKKDRQFAIKNMALFKPIMDIYMPYIYWYLYSQQEPMKEYASGGVQSFVSLNYLRNYLIPLPPLAEQRRIVEKLESLMPLIERYGKSQEALNALNASLPEKLRQSILQEAIQGHLVPQDPNEEPASVLLERIRAEKARLVKEGKLKKKDLEEKPISPDEIPFDIPEGWVWCRIQDVVSNRAGLAYDKGNLDIKTDSMIRVLRGGNISNGKWTIKDDDVKIASTFVNEDLLLKKGTFITPAVTSLENMGKTALIENDQKDIVVGGFVLMLQMHLVLDVFDHFLLYFFQSLYFKKSCQKIANKSGQAFYNLSRQKMSQMLIPLPPLSEQRRIVTKLEELLQEIDKLKA